MGGDEQPAAAVEQLVGVGVGEVAVGGDRAEVDRPVRDLLEAGGGVGALAGRRDGPAERVADPAGRLAEAGVAGGDREGDPVEGGAGPGRRGCQLGEVLLDRLGPAGQLPGAVSVMVALLAPNG